MSTVQIRTKLNGSGAEFAKAPGKYSKHPTKAFDYLFKAYLPLLRTALAFLFMFAHIRV
jgi:hypothetical protein